MAKYGVNLPIVGYVYIEVEAENEQDAIDKALEAEWKDEDIQEEYTVEHVCSGNACYHPYADADAELVED